MADTSLVIEGEQSRRRQAELSRLQSVLGLKKNITANDLKSYKYGDDLAALEADKPTGLECKCDAHILSMNLEVNRNAAGEVTNIVVDVARLCTVHLTNESPNDFVTTVQKRSHTKRYLRGSNAVMSEEELGYARYHIHSMVHPCTGENDHIAWGVHDHTGHKKCFVMPWLVLIFANKDKAVRDLQSLGYNPETDIRTLDIYDLRELNQAYMVRCDASTRGPKTGGQRTELPENDQLSTVDEILKARKCFSSGGQAQTLALGMLKAAVKMASDDATTGGWVRTLEQVDGGLFSQPRKLRNKSEVNGFLLEFDLAVMRPSSKQILDLTLEAETTRFHGLPERMQVCFSVNRAQRHRFVDFFAKFPMFAHVEKQTVQVRELIRIASEEARLKGTIPPATEYTYQAPAANTLGAAGTSNTTSSSHNKLQKDLGLPYDLNKVGCTYTEVGRDISRRLVAFLESKMDSWPESERAQIKKMYSIGQDFEHGTTVNYPESNACYAFKTLARQARKSDYIMDDEMASWFITAIKGRRQLRNWYDRLPSNDSRFEANSRHEAWLQTLIEVVVALAGHQY